jgi:hypothetical protein
MKCSKCFVKDCGRKYLNRHVCVGEEEGIQCTCICQVSSKEASIASAASFGSGLAAIVGEKKFKIFLFGVNKIKKFV